MPVTTRKSYLLSQQQNKSITSALITSVVDNNDLLDQANLNTVEIAVPSIEITGTMNIERSELEVFPFEETFYDSYDNIKLSGELCQTSDIFTSDIQREKALATLFEQEEQLRSVLLEKSTCLLSPPMSECDPCSPVARARSTSVAETFVSSPYVSAPASPEQDAALDIFDTIINNEPTQAVTYESYVVPAVQEEFLSVTDEIVTGSQESIDFELDDVLDFISSQMEDSRDMFTQEKNCFKAAITSQDDFTSQSYPGLTMNIADTVAEDALTPTAFLEDSVIDEILSFDTQQSCASPTHSIDSVTTSAQSLASPAHSVTSDEDYLPVAELKRKNGVGAKRGRKRKVEYEFGDDVVESKKLKNASAAARYRQKKKQEEQVAFAELEKVEAEVAKTRDRFNDALKKRNFFLEFLYEENKKKQLLNFPDWVGSYLKKMENY